MRNLFASVCAVAIIASSNTVRAENPEDIHHTGSFTCSGDNYVTDWRMSQGLGGEVATTVYYQRTGSSQVEWLELTQRGNGQGHQLYDANGNERLAVIVDGDQIRAIWKLGAPNSECAPFTVRQSQSPKERFDMLFGLMETPEPNEDVAAKVAELTKSPPIVQGLPELDRQIYFQRYASLEQTFWSGYREALLKTIAEQPLSTKEDRKTFSERMSSALSDPSRFMRGRGGFESALTMVQQGSDRYTASGGLPAEELYAGGELACQRLQGILKADPYFDFSKLEIAVGVSSDYWTRTLAENLLSGLRECADVPKDYARQLTNKWPDIQERQQLVLSLVKEQSRLRSLPLSTETLVATKNLQPDEDTVRSMSRRSSDYQRFFGASLDARREELLNVSLSSIKDQSNGYSLDTPVVAESVSQACDTLRNLPGTTGETQEKVSQACDAAIETIADKQAEQAISQIKAAFAAVDPGSDTEEAAGGPCETLPSTLVSQAAARVYEVCASEKAVVEEKRTALKCEQAIAQSGASADLLASRVWVKGGEAGSGAAVQDLICNATKMGAQISFSTSGYLAWKTYAMDMKMERAREGEDLLHFVLSPMEGEADWVVGTEDEGTKTILAKQGAPLEIVTACIMRTSACRQ